MLSQFNLLTDPLTAEQLAMRQAIINEAYFIQMTTSLNARLLQCRSSIKAISKAMRDALANGESEDSLYVKEMGYRLIVLIAQEEELSALVGAENKTAA